MTNEEIEYIKESWRKKFDEFLYQEGKKCILFNTPVHCNLGDHLIASGVISFLNDCGIDNIFEVPTDDYRFAIDYIRSTKVKLPIFITGGGFVTNLWEEELNRVFDIIKSFPDNYVIILPQTIFFANDENMDKYFNCAKELFNRKKLIIFAREKVTLDFCKTNFPKVKTYLAPDMGLYITKPDLLKETTDTINPKVLLVFRDDKEKESNIKEEIVKKLNKLKIKYEFGTTMVLAKEKWIPLDKREEYLQKKFEEFSKYDLIITDRLHGMIFATILKVKCIAFDNLSHKVKNVYDIYLKNVPYVEFLNNSLSFEKKLDQMLNMDLEKIKHPKFNFRKLKLVMLKLYWRFYGKN